jgi:tetrahydromethanopterin S-methyltransferase subunit B
MEFEMRRQRDGNTVIARVPDVVRWAAVIAGVVIGLGIFAMLNALWWAIEYSAGDGWVSRNLAWLLGGSAAVSLLLAGLIAGAIAGVRGTLAGLVNGATAWGLLFLVSLTAIIPGGLNLTSKLRSGVEQGATTLGGYPGAGARFTVAWTLWTTFWSLLVGLVLAVVGGMLGARLRRPATFADQYPQNANAPVEPFGAHGQRQSRAAVERNS